jgi:2-polyprenyl-3-methyl-5-hydroxy-6-metoxy-1,4-benzoquinol methylase
MNSKLVQILVGYVETAHFRSLKGVEEALAVNPERFEQIAEMFLEWAVRARGEKWIPAMVDAFVAFSTDVNIAQVRYEADGHYPHKTLADCYEELYARKDSMSNYLWGVYLTNFLWAHHMELCLFFEDRFLTRLEDCASIVEIAPGHGGWGIWALSRLNDARLQGYDISSSSIKIARQLADSAGVKERARYIEKNALELPETADGSADACICSFLVEHLEEPEKLFAIIADFLKPNAKAYISGALTAAQIDHIFEFRHESEIVLLCEKYGLRLLESVSVNPRRTLPKARFLPRSQAVIVEKRPLH